MDKFDATILDALQVNARMSWVQLAERINLSTSACQRRVEALQRKGVIEGFTVRLNEKALGHNVKAFVTVTVDRQNPELAHEFRRWVNGQTQVKTCHMISGTSDYMLEVAATDLEAFGQFLDSELLALASVKDATSSIVLGRVK